MIADKFLKMSSKRRMKRDSEEESPVPSTSKKTKKVDKPVPVALVLNNRGMVCSD